MKKPVIPVFFTIDEAYAPYLAVAANSLIRNASPRYDYRLIVLHQGLSQETMARLRQLERPYAKFRFVAIRQSFDQFSDHISDRLRADYFTLTIFFRLFIPDMFPEYDKAIYLDSDVVVTGDISALYETELGDRLLGACLDLSIHDIPELVTYITDAMGAGKERYFNSGVLLMNLRRLREVHLAERFLEVHKRWHFDCIAPDQDYLNALCMGQVLYLDPRWDTMPNRAKPEVAHPLLIHYNLFEKPWMYDGIQYAAVFWHYAMTSGYMDWLIEHKNTYSDLQKAEDSRCLRNLVARGKQIAAMPDNFRDVFESGREQRL